MDLEWNDGQYEEETIIEVNETKKKSFLNELFTPRLILLRSLNMFFQWFSVTMVYYGLLFASTSLSGNAYQNFTLVVLAELPSILLYLKLNKIRGSMTLNTEKGNIFWHSK